MLIMTRRVGEVIVVGDSIRITVVSVEQGSVRVGIDAPREIAVHREEVFQRLRGQSDAGSLGSNSGLPHIPSEEAAREQWMRGPRVSSPSIATLLVQQSEAIPANLGLNNGVPDLGLTWVEAIALVEENKRRGGRTVTRKTHTERYAERAAREKPPK